MSRLVDADDFKRFLQALCKAGAPYEEVIQLLDKQPTAYDVEKVVEELEQERERARVGSIEAVRRGMAISSDNHLIKKRSFEKAIEIVRKGGIND